MSSELFADVKLDFGAVGDGSAHDSQAVQNALNSPAAKIFFPDGTYLLQDIAIPSNKTLWGSGKILSASGSDVTFAMFGDDSTIEGLTFIGVR